MYCGRSPDLNPPKVGRNVVSATPRTPCFSCGTSSHYLASFQPLTRTYKLLVFLLSLPIITNQYICYDKYTILLDDLPLCYR